MSSTVTEVAISRLHWPVTTLGFGKRIGIWFQGCSIQCRGCCAHDTWEAESGNRITIDDLLAWIIRLQPVNRIDGVTISGGEPFDQPEALDRLVSRLRDALSVRKHSADILVYSGHPWRRLKYRHAGILDKLDAVISEPFVVSRPTAWLCGSSNQQIHCLSVLGEERYGTPSNDAADRNLQIDFDGKRIWITGIPRRDDLDRLGAKLERAGINISGLSWRS